MRSIADPAQLGRFFAAYTEHAFHDVVGATDSRVVDYLSGLLVRFVHRDQIFTIRAGSGSPFVAIADMLDSIERSDSVGKERRELFRHIGDFTLFWTGVFPEAVERRKKWLATQGVAEYTEGGKRSYFVASTYNDTPEQANEAPVLRQLSEEFELCAVGLRRARELWEAEIPPIEPAEP